MNEAELIDYWSSVRDIIDKTCADYDVLWQKRNRTLNTKIILIMIFKITACNRQYGLSSNLTEFWDICAEKNIKLPQEKPIAASSFCEARQKLSEDIFKDLNKKLMTNWDEKRRLHRWFGHRIFAVDGSRINIPRELTAYGFKIYDETRRHYPQGLLSCLYDVLSKTVYDFDFVSHMNERKCALQHLKVVQPNDIMIFDRGYFSYLMLHEFHNAGVHALFRMQEGSVNKQVEAFIASSEHDLIINYIPSAAVISDLKKQGYHLKPTLIPLRLFKHIINGETYLYGTTLLDKEKYPALGLAELYHERWDIEELYKISKHIIDIEEFHSKTERGVKQEMYAHLLLINLSRFFEFDAKDDLPPMSDHDKEKCSAVNFYKLFNPTTMFNINFKNCLSIVGRYIENLVLAAYDQLKKWTPKVIQMMLRVRQKIRPGRSYPRNSHKPAKKWGAKGKSMSAIY
jgi:IS4 transposase